AFVLRWDAAAAAPIAFAYGPRGPLEDGYGGVVVRLSEVDPYEVLEAHGATSKSGVTSSLIAPATSSYLNTLSVSSLNSQRYSCSNHQAGMLRLSSSRNWRLMRGTSDAVTLTRFHPSPWSQTSQKWPRFPNGVLMSSSRPLVVASIGLIE